MSNLLFVLVGSWLLGGLFVNRQVTQQKASRWAVASAAVTTVMTAGVLVFVWQRGPLVAELAGRVSLAADVESLLLATLTGLVTTTVLAAGARRELTRSVMARLLVVAGATLLVFFASDLVTLAAGWTAGIALLSGSDEASRRFAGRLLLTSALPLCAAVVWIGAVGGRLDLRGLEEGTLPAQTTTWVMLLIVVASAARMGIPPFHRAWVRLLDAGDGARAIAVVGPLTGAYALLRLGPPLSQAFVADQPWLEAWALTAAMYLAVVAFGQRKQLRLAGYLVASQIALVFLALCSSEEVAVHGGLTLWLALGPALTGFLLTAQAIRSRRGPVDIVRHHGLVNQAPLLAGLAFVFGMASVGLPLTLTFVAEDIIAQGLLVPHPWLAAGFVAVTALNAINMLRHYGRVYLGATPRVRCPDLSGRERVTLVALAALILVAGLAPQLALTAEADTAHHLHAAETSR